jgi:hypothetical protein
MLTYKDKDLDTLTLTECYEFEKEMLSRLTVASKSGFSDLIIGQLNSYIDLIRFRKVEILERERFGIDREDYNPNKVLNIGDEQEQSDDTD